MSKIEMLRVLITQRLTEAAEEIFGVFGRTIAEYEEEISRSKLEIDRQRRLLDLSVKPRVSVQVSGSALCQQQDWSSGPDLKEPRTPHIKEEQEEELWPPQQEDEEEEEEDEEEEEEQQHNNAKFLLFQSSRSRLEQDTNHTTSSLSQLQDLQNLQDPQPGPSVQQTCSDLDEASDPASGNGQLGCIDLETPLAEAVDSYICTICGRAFAQHGHWAKHVQVHRRVETKVDKSYTCDICGKKLTRFDGYQKHLRIHTGEKPYSCDKCGRRFSDNSNYKRHIRTHPGQKPPQS